MRHKLAIILANTGLLAVVLMLLSGPLLLGQLLGTAQSGALGVTSSRTEGAVLSVLPNTTDFNQYVQFNPSPVVEPKFYQTSVTFTAFAGQQASYNGLLTVYNAGTEPLRINLQGGKLSGQIDQSQIWLTLAPDTASATTLLTEKAEVGATTLTVADASAFTQGQAVVEQTPLTAVKVSATELSLAAPLKQALPVGSKVYLGAIAYLRQPSAIPDTSQIVTLAPQTRASVSLTVATDLGGPDKQQLVLPVVISVE